MNFLPNRIVRLSICLLALALICSLPALSAGKSWVTVTRKAGTVESKLANSQSWLRIPNSRRLGLDDSVRTNESGKAHLKLADNSIIALNPSTNIVLREFALNSGKRSVKVDIGQGHLRTQVSKFRGRDNRYQISSPNAVMAAQGTDFSVEVSGEGETIKTVLRVISGAVTIAQINNGPETLVSAGQGAIVQGNQSPTVAPLVLPGEQLVPGAIEAESEIKLPKDGDQKLLAIPGEYRGELGADSTVPGLNTIGSAGEHTNEATPILPNEPGLPNPDTSGSINLDLTPFFK